MKKILVIFIILVLANIINYASAASTVGPYNTLSECNEVLEKNSSNQDPDYSKYERSECYSSNGKYQYNICEEGEGCTENTNSTNRSTSNDYSIDNPYGSYKFTFKGKEYTIEKLFGEKIKILIKKLKGDGSLEDSLKKLIRFNKKLNRLLESDKYKNNKLIQNLIKYIIFEVNNEISILKKEIENNTNEDGLKDFLCELEGNCEEKIPLTCTKWYDGCNECSVLNGKIGLCTQKLVYKMMHLNV
ncbi:MAG: hypothetical protein Q9M97_06555 [Candidatus Gracilibacteria bacterium]|nr:hypothetical protein [Candidatus Gracilibacteria bacterium]